MPSGVGTLSVAILWLGALHVNLTLSIPELQSPYHSTSRTGNRTVGERLQRQIDRLLDEAKEAIARLASQVVRDRNQAVLRPETENRDAVAHVSATGRDFDCWGADAC